MLYERHVQALPLPSPGSPPAMSSSKSSRSSKSSFGSNGSDDASVLADISHFEDIGLDDDAHLDARHLHDQHLKAAPNPYSPNFSSDLRSAKRNISNSTPRVPPPRDLPNSRPKRDFTPLTTKTRPSFPSLQTQVRSVNGRVASLGLLPEPYLNPSPTRSIRNRPSLSIQGRPRSPSPGLSLSPRDPNLMMKPRRSSWQSGRERRKSALELELECDEDDGDDIPDGLILDNVPISPRPPQERAKSQPCSKAPSPERQPKERVRSVGNGTPAVAVDSGSLRSPTWKSESALSSMGSASSSHVTSPVVGRAKSWNAALAELNADAKALTEKLEEHADELDVKAQRSSTGSIPTRRSSDPETKPRVKSALAELPPLRRTNIMIDPLPISKEKEAVLSRTRPSWLPPKDPAEERRHLKEYQKMMAHSLEADRRREAAKRARSECRDTAVDSLMQIWERDILPRWNDAIRERRTRDLWWRGIAPRSRGAVWTKAIGNELGLTKTSFEAALGRAHDAEAKAKTGQGSVEETRAAAWFKAIRKDAQDNTWPDLRIFQASGPLHQSLVDILSAYAMYRSDIGYVPGCNVSCPVPLRIVITLTVSRLLRLFCSSTSQHLRTPLSHSQISSTGHCR